MRILGNRVITTFGNQEMAADGLTIWATPAPDVPFNNNGKYKCLIPKGQPFAYEKGKNVTIGIGQLDKSKKVNICVHTLGGDVRCTSGDGIKASNIVNYKADTAYCGVTPVWDLLIKCTQCDVGYGINVMHRSNDTEQNKNPGQWDILSLTSVVPCASCTNCTDADYSRKVAGEFARQMLPMTDINFNNVGTHLGNLNPPEVPYTLRRVFPNSKEWCISPSNENSCKSCNRYTAIKAVRITIDAVPTTYPLVDYLASGSTTQGDMADIMSLVDQIDRVAQIAGGSATLSGGTLGVCCDTKIHINHCGTVELLGTDDQPITECSTTNAVLAAVPDPFLYPDCNNLAPGSTTYTEGIRIIFKPITIDCQPCSISIPGKNFYGYDVSVEATAGFVSGNFYIRNTVEGRSARGLGAQFVADEYRQPHGGIGRRYSGYNMHEGFFGNLTADSRANQAVTLMCQSGYCSVHLGVIHKVGDTSTNEVERGAKWQNLMLIPTTDTLTMTSLLDFLNHFAAMSPHIPEGFLATCWDGNALVDPEANPSLDNYAGDGMVH